MNAHASEPGKTRHRLFFAVWPPPAVCAELERLQRRLGDVGRTLPPHRLHMTVVFLGDADPDTARAAADEAVRSGGVEAFRMELDHLSRFPRQRILWVAPAECPAPLTALHGQLRRSLRRRGIRLGGRAFHPHITLFRKAVPVEPGVADPIQWPVHELVLIDSVRHPDGPAYERLAGWPLDEAERSRRLDGSHSCT